MVKATGVHHLAIMSADIKAQIAFFSDVLGCQLVAIFDMHGVPGGVHAFLHLDDECYFSIVQLPAVADIPIEMGVTHAGSGAGACAPGTLQHLALKADSRADLLAMRDRIRSRGVNVIGPIRHGICESIYFAGPEQLTLEVATSNEPINPRQWVDPAVAEKVGISAEDLAIYCTPAPYAGEAGQVPQPPFDPAKPHQAYPKDLYQQLLKTPDDVITAQASFEDPPVRT
jgi:catechol 2,3-dioxygenase-like lactoylglutathione lyase family enzyme